MSSAYFILFRHVKIPLTCYIYPKRAVLKALTTETCFSLRNMQQVLKYTVIYRKSNLKDKNHDI